MPPMNSSGMNTAISEKVIEMIVKPICPAPLSAASNGRSPMFDIADDVLDHHDASSTINPTEIVSAINEMLSRL